MRFHRPALGAALMLVTLSPRALGAQDTVRVRDTARVVNLAPIAVTAVRERAVAPPVVTVTVDAEHVRRTQATTPWDLVRRLAGIEIHEQGQGPGFASDAVLRGFTSDHSSDVLLVIDGVPINLPVHGHVEGYADWNVLVPASLRELRVMHGPSSPLHGDFAFGGVVEGYIDHDTDRPAAAVTTSSDGDVGGWLRTGGRGPGGGGIVVAEGRRNQGWRDHASYALGNVLGSGWRALPDARIEGGFSLYGSRWDSPGFLSVARYNARDLVAAVDPTDGGEAGRAIVHGRYTRALGGGGVQVEGWGQALRSTVFLNLPDDGVLAQSEERDARVAVGLQSQAVWRLATGDATVGLSARADADRYQLFQTTARVRDTTTTDVDGDYRSAGLFARWRSLVGTRVALDVGGRVDAMRYASLDRFTPGAGALSATHWVASPKLGARVLLSGTTALLASVSRGFRGAPGVINDPAREPLTAWAGELGVRAVTARLVAHVAAFRLDVSHERIQDPVTRVISDAGASVRQGLTADLDAHVGRAVLSGSVTLNDASITETVGVAQPAVTVLTRRDGLVGVPALPSFHVEPLEPGDPVPGVGNVVGRVTADWRLNDGAAARATWRFSGPFTPIGEPGVRTQAYGVLDLGATIQLPYHRAVLDVELENALNTRYPEVRASGFLNPGAHRTLRAGVRFGDGPAAHEM